MPQSTAVELDVTFGHAALVRFPGAGHYKVGNLLDESGLLIENGFQAVDRNTVTVIVREGVSPTTAVEMMTREIERLVASGEIRLGL